MSPARSAPTCLSCSFTCAGKGCSDGVHCRSSWITVMYILLSTAGFLVQQASASEGDADAAFRACHAGCMSSGCAQLPGTADATKQCDIACTNNGYMPPPVLRLTQWDCNADCAYHCMWLRENQRREEAQQQRREALLNRRAQADSSQHSVRVQQQHVPRYITWKYSGKWPFVRVLGAQEIASVVFSLLNLAAHAHNLHRLLRAHRALGGARSASGVAARNGTVAGAVTLGGSYPYLWLWAMYAAFSMNAWVWSIVFHTRDTKTTERLDYLCGADPLVAVSLLSTIVRTAGLVAPLQCAAATLIVAAGLGRHVYHMAAVRFDYSYNMTVCVALGIMQGVLWLGWGWKVRHPAYSSLCRFTGAVYAAMLLEVLDFPPLALLLDAHALWHAATAPLTYWWYDFLIADMNWVMRGGIGSSPAPGRTGKRLS